MQEYLFLNEESDIWITKEAIIAEELDKILSIISFEEKEWNNYKKLNYPKNILTIITPSAREREWKKHKTNILFAIVIYRLGLIPSSEQNDSSILLNPNTSFYQRVGSIVRKSERNVLLVAMKNIAQGK